MDGYRENDGSQLADGGASARARRFGLVLLGIFAFVVISIALESETGIPWPTTYRIACIGLCQYLIYKLIKDCPEERWLVVAFWAALAVNFAILMSPLTDGPPSRGELMVFGVPDAVVALGIATATYKATNAHERAVRQQMILGLVLATLFCAFLFFMVLLDPHHGRSWGHLLSTSYAR